METQKDNTNNSARVQLDHILLATNLLQDSKILILLDEFGEVALGRYIHLITCIGREGGSMPEVACFALGRLLGVAKEDWVKFVTACSEVGLVTINNKEVSISRLIKQSEKVANQQRRWRENKQTPKTFPEDSSENPQRTTRDSDSESKEEEEEKEQEEENKSKKNSQPELVFPNSWGSVTKAAFAEWQAYRKESRKPLKNRSYQAQINQFANDPRLFCDLVARAIRKGWQGLNEEIPLENDEKHSSRNNGPPPKHRQSNAEQTIDAVMEVLREVRNET